MCDPVSATIAAGVMSVAGTTAMVVQQSHAAKAQALAINQQAQVVTEENRQATSAEMFDRMRAARREQARMRVAAGEAGLGLNSGSIGQLLMDSAMQAGLANERSLANRESRDAATRAGAVSSLSQVQSPSLLGAGLQIGSAAVSGWSDISAAKIAAKPVGSAYLNSLLKKGASASTVSRAPRLSNSNLIKLPDPGA